MLQWVILGGLWVLLRKDDAANKQQTAQVGDPLMAQCPTDPHMPAFHMGAVRACWAQGTAADCEQLANECGLQFPIARNTLMARAYDLNRAATKLKEKEASKPPAPKLTKEDVIRKENEAAIKATANGDVKSTRVIDVEGVVVEEHPGVG